MGARAVRWTGEDRAKALAFVLEKSTRCVMCGTADWEWEEDRHAYEPVTRFCHGCYAKDYMAEDAGRAHGVTIDLAPTHGLEAAKRQVAYARMAHRADR